MSHLLSAAFPPAPVVDLVRVETRPRGHMSQLERRPAGNVIVICTRGQRSITSRSMVSQKALNHVKRITRHWGASNLTHHLTHTHLPLSLAPARAAAPMRSVTTTRLKVMAMVIGTARLHPIQSCKIRYTSTKPRSLAEDLSSLTSSFF